jgi:O-antigen/teichoic acid export membrane protein
MNAVMQSALARTASFLPSALAALAASHLIIANLGISTFDSFSLILTLVSLIPLNNLGVGAAVTSAYASKGPGAESSVRVMLTAIRVLAISSLCTAASATMIGGLGAWPELLGHASGPNAWCALAVIVYALSFVPGLGYSALLGVNRNHVAILVQSLYQPLILLMVAVVIATGSWPSLVLCAVPAAMVLTNLTMCWFAHRSTANVDWFGLFRKAFAPRVHRGISTRAISGPMLITSLVTPIALQSDRVVLSHVSTEQAIANYSVLLQVIAPALALIAAASQPLWPIYAKARRDGERGPSLARVLLTFCLGAGVVGAGLALIANPLGHLIGGDKVDMGIALPVAGALFVVVSAAAYPLAMYLMDPRGVRFVAGCSAVALPANVILSVILAQRMGAPGPLLASCLVGIVVQTGPAVIYIRFRRPPGRHRRGKASYVDAGAPSGSADSSALDGTFV